MFVKAKINLQNAADASAFAGAAVQARQLTNIAYLNWEMRNIYKEWMFKYYILGNLQLKAISNTSSNPVSFAMSSIPGTAQDKYNIPSICIEYGVGAGTSICKTYQVPGIPEFPDAGIAMIDNATTAFVNAIEEQKNEDCANRSQLNFLVNNLWAYNVTTNNQTIDSITKVAPNIAGNRLGAWPAAFEMAIRIRNLENVVNLPPYTGGVCLKPGSSKKISCRNEIETLVNTQNTAGNERIYKAFMSGYRTFGEVASGTNDLKNTYTLTELPPRPFSDTNENSLSNLLIPSTNREKHYLDLKLIPLNLATFYTSFVTAKGSSNIGGQQISSASGCDATKIALPVPGYPFGFVKNPDFITYYAVKAEAEFVGLFNPFKDTQIKLTAYAAAKPFGGRIGPNLFNTNGSDPSIVNSRTTSDKFRTSGYLSGLDISSVINTSGQIVSTPGAYVSGSPIPGNDPDLSFWISSPTDPIGGWIDPASEIRFAIPNLVYDYIDDPTNTSYNSSESVQIIKPASGSEPSTGLYTSKILEKFKSNLEGIGGPIGSDAIESGILKARAPTFYEANNYLIPLPQSLHKELQVDSFGELNHGSGDHYILRLYAPLVGDSKDYLYHSPSQILSEATKYLSHQEPAIEKYRDSMNLVAKKVSEVTTQGGAKVGMAAAKVISDIDFNQNYKSQKPTCNSMTGRFLYFYLGSTSVSTVAGCSESLKDLLQKYWSEKGENSNIEKDFYTIQYKTDFEPIKRKLFTAYRPHNLQGAENGVMINPYTHGTEHIYRNFYSTKLISLRSISSQNRNFYNDKTSGFPVISEGNVSIGGYEEINQQNFKNALDSDFISIDFDRITQ